MERLFSTAEDILGPKRACLSEQNFDHLVFLRGNLHLDKNSRCQGDSALYCCVCNVLRHGINFVVIDNKMLISDILLFWFPLLLHIHVCNLISTVTALFQFLSLCSKRQWNYSYRYETIKMLQDQHFSISYLVSKKKLFNLHFNQQFAFDLTWNPFSFLKIFLIKKIALFRAYKLSAVWLNISNTFLDFEFC